MTDEIERHIYGLEADEIDSVIAFMTKNNDRMSNKEKNVLISLVELRYNTKGKVGTIE